MYIIKFYEDQSGYSEVADYLKELSRKAKEIKQAKKKLQEYLERNG